VKGDHEGAASAPGDDAAPGVDLLLVARAVAYDIGRRAFLEEPSETFVRLLIEGDVVRSFPFADGNAAMSQALEAIGEYLRQPDVLSKKSCEVLRWDYTRMFVGPGRLPAPPWESLYRDAERLHLSEQTLQVRAAYQKYGLSPRDLGREPDDHIGFELDFMHKLCELTKQKAKEGDAASLQAILEDQRTFLDEHLLGWVPAWTTDVVKSAETDFFKGMAQLLRAYLALDRELVHGLLEALRRDLSSRPPS
jgi:TorA maturation chaperone TorD